MRGCIRAALTATLVLGTVSPVHAQERVDEAAIGRIRDEGLNRSQVPELARQLNDVIGPRLTGSTGMKRANEWTAQKFREWGLTGVAIEPWGEFGLGWERVSYEGRVVEPFIQPLNAQPLAWTGSTEGVAAGPVVAITAVTPDELRQQYAGRLRGAWVLPTEHVGTQPEFRQITRRFSDEELLTPLAAGTPQRQGQPPQGRPGQPQAGQPQAGQPQPAGQPRGRPAQPAGQPQGRPLQRAVGPTMQAALDTMMRAEGGLGYLRPSQWAYGTLRVSSAGSRRPEDPRALPSLLVSLEQYGQLWRNATNDVPTRVEIAVQNRFLSDDLQAYNTFGEIRGSDRADEYVMIGAHLDSWHSGTGATDNGAGTVVMMEAMRILKTLGLQPRRTIRIGLWSGEEQGLLGSRAWTRGHPELHPKISAYLNVDNGTGMVRGIWNQGNAAVTPIFEQILAPFRDLGVVAVRHGNTGGTDHLAFDAVGVPGFNFIQDPIEYSLRTHHSNADTFDHLLLDDLKQAAVVVAATAYHLAMRDEMVPRKPAPASDGNR